MSERTSYAPGTPSWVDLGSPDPDAAASFYRGLFGWSIDGDAPPEAGGYTMCMLRGQPVAGLGPQMNQDMPPFWSVYVTVAGADEALAKAESNGGVVVVPAMDVLDVGRMGIIQDPVGSYISVWEPRRHVGAGLVNEPGTFMWNELATTDVVRAASFYTAVFGWGLGDTPDPAAAAMFTVGGELVCGGHLAAAGEFPSWSVWFAVEDCDAAATRAVELGGSLVMGPVDMDFGRGAMVADPHGAVFGIGAVRAGV